MVLERDKKNLVSLLFIFALGLALNINTVANEFTYDDFPVIVENQNIKDLGAVKNILTESRSVRSLTLAFDHALFGLDPAGYHIQNILWHILNAFLLHLLVWKLSGSKKLAIVVALIFIVHPVHAESVANVSNRKDLLCLFFMLASFLLFIEAKKKIRFLKVALYLATSLLFLLAIYSKQVAIMLPLLFILYEMIFLSRGERTFSKIFIFTSPIVIAMLYFLWGDTIQHNNRLIVESISLESHHQVYTVIKSFLHYIRYSLFPVNLSADHTWTFEYSFWNGAVLLPLFFFLFALVLSLKRARKNKLFSFAILWFIVNWLPVSNIIAGFTYFFAERYLYIPSVGFCILMGCFFQSLLEVDSRSNPFRKRVVFSLFVLMLLIMSAQTISRNTIWQTQQILWSDTAKKSPKSSSAHNNLGNLFFLDGDYDSAVARYKKVLEIIPNHREASFNLSMIYRERMQFDEAELVLRRGLSSGIDDDAIYYRLAQLYRDSARYEEALAALENVSNENGIPGYDKSLSGEIFFYVGRKRLDEHDYQGALMSFRKALVYDYARPDIDKSMAEAYFGMENYGKAVESYEKVLKVNQNYLVAYFFIAEAHYQMGENVKALEFYKKFLGGWRMGGKYFEKAKEMSSLIENDGNLRK